MNAQFENGAIRSASLNYAVHFGFISFSGFLFGNTVVTIGVVYSVAVTN